MKTLLRSSFLTTFLTLFIATGYAETTDIETTSLNWVGCGISKKSYLTHLSEAYSKLNPIQINIQGGGATRGIRDVANQTADFGGSCRYHLPGHDLEQQTAFEPIAWDALAIIVHPNNPITNLSLFQVKQIYSGEITNWKSVGGEDKVIKLFTREGKISGVGYSIRSLIFSDVTKTFAFSKEFKSSGPLEKAVELELGSIAITGVSSARLRDVKILSLNNKQPDYQSIKSGKYVLYRPLYITYSPTGAKLEQVKDFIKFAHSSEGKDIMIQNGVVPYLDALRLVMIQSRQTLSSQVNSDVNLTYE